jgi:hypothetical protein
MYSYNRSTVRHLAPARTIILFGLTSKTRTPGKIVTLAKVVVTSSMSKDLMEFNYIGYLLNWCVEGKEMVIDLASFSSGNELSGTVAPPGLRNSESVALSILQVSPAGHKVL